MSENGKMRKHVTLLTLVALMIAPALAREPSALERLVIKDFLQCQKSIKKGCDAFSAGDFVKAISFFSPLAEAGDPAAQNNMGVLYEAGAGVKENKSEALGWYMKAAEKGLAIAQHNLAVLLAADHILGTAEPSRKDRDFVDAYVWLSLAAAQGLEIASRGLKDLEKHMSSELVSQAKERVERKPQTKD